MNIRFSVQIDNVPDPLTFSDIVEIVVDTNVFLPGMFTILLEDRQAVPGASALTYTDNVLRFRIGASVSITATILPPSTYAGRVTLIKGEITAIEPVFTRDGRVLLRLRGYDRAYRLTRGRTTRTFGNANPRTATITEAQIVKEIAQKAGLTPRIDPSGLRNARYHYVMQYNQNDWDFLWARAQLLGYQVYVEDRELYFVPADKPRQRRKPAPLVWGENLRSFEPRLAANEQVSAVHVSGWDADKKARVAASKKARPSLKGGPMPRNKAEDAIADPLVQTPGLAKTLASARLAARQSSLIRASGELADGDPRLLAGALVEVKNVGVRFSGEYYITAARHIYRKGEYQVRFEISGHNPYTFRRLLLGEEHQLNRIYGVVIGEVTDNNDPQKLGRVQVRYPWMPQFENAELSSNWARMAAPGAGAGRGLLFLPEIGDEVLVAFENGDVNSPYIVGALWNGRDQPPIEKVLAQNKVNQRVIRSRSGHVVILDDTQGSERITILDKTGQNSIEIDSKNNAISLRASGDITIEAGGRLVLKSKQEMNLESNAAAAIKGSKLDMQGQSGAVMKAGASQVALQSAGATLKGTRVTVQASSQAAIKGSALVEIKGGLVKIN